VIAGFLHAGLRLVLLAHTFSSIERDAPPGCSPGAGSGSSTAGTDRASPSASGRPGRIFQAACRAVWSHGGRALPLPRGPTPLFFSPPLDKTTTFGYPFPTMETVVSSIGVSSFLGLNRRTHPDGSWNHKLNSIAVMSVQIDLKANDPCVSPWCSCWCS
jgi:hypothetical protein